MSEIVSEFYEPVRGRWFKFNDLVVAESLFGVPDEKRVGRLVQVRKGAGAFRSDLLFFRLRDGNLASFHNVLLRKADDEIFVNCYYHSNGMTPPEIPDPSEFPEDNAGEEYLIDHQYPETGFIVENPRQPEDPQQSFSMIIKHAPEVSHE